jgi:putative phage-type endonuclease
VIVYDVPQRTPEWFALRAGKLTASRANDMTALLKSQKEAAARRDLRTQLVVERLTGQAAESGYQNDDMLRGIELEPEALAATELLLDTIISPVGFVQHDELLAGASPDGVIGAYDGIVEIKCPKSATHFSYWKAGVVPQDYLFQIVHQLWLTGAPWCEFVSFDPRFPPHLQLFHVRHDRDDAEIDSYELLVRQFLREVDLEVEAMAALGHVA